MRRIFVLSLSLALAACGSTPVIVGSPDSGQDGGAPSDGGPVADGGGAFDGGPGLDGGFPIDGGQPGPDGGSPSDGGAPSDGGSPSDGGAPGDGGAVLAGDRCANAEALTPGTTIQATTAGYADDLGGGPNCAQPSQDGSGADRVYSLTIPPGKRLTAVATPEGFDVVLNLVRQPANNCAAQRTCLIGQDGPGVGGAETLVYENRGADPLLVFLVVDGYSPGDEGPFSLQTTLTDVGAPLPGDTCASAETLGVGTTVAGTLVGYTNDYSGGSNCAQPSQDGAGPDRVYSITVPPQKRLDVNVAPSQFDVMVSFVVGTAQSCSRNGMTCVASADSGGGGQTERATYTNTSGAAQTVFVIVQGFTPGDTGAFNIQATLTDAAALPGDVCATATLLTPGQFVSATTVGYSNDYGATSGHGCVAAPGLDRVHSVTVPSGATLSVTVTPTSNWDVALSFVVGPAGMCGPSHSCAASTNQGGPQVPETASYRNQSNGSQTVFVIVDSPISGQAGTYNIVGTLTGVGG